ncbi:MAG: squalene--hopene cyclase [Planctomycetaceae bacterium]|jgi:squalene-hopene/tetraprenyl-beta-curcumene cyclase|nr:squalene--hopene cyclase [Planctomycetaceae bacterium]
MDPYLYNMNRSNTFADCVCPSREMLQPTPETNEIFSQELRRSIAATRQFFFNHQHPNGYWVAELEGDALLQSETILLLAFLGEENSELAKACAVQLVDTQLADGGWGMYTGGISDVNNTVKAYFALKLTGYDPASEIMQHARVRALELGGVDKVNSFTRFYLAILGQIPHCVCPAVPPQMMLLPKWFPINIYAMSAWSRTIFVPLSIVSALSPVRELPPEKGIREIFVKNPSQWQPLTAPGKTISRNPLSWDSFFRFCNSAMWVCRRFGLTPLRQYSIEKAKQWTLEHCKESDGPGAIYPPIVWAWIAFKTLGYADDSQEILYFRKQLNDLVIKNEKRGSVRIQPCKSPVWDTVLTLKALMLGGLTAAHPAVRQGVRWVRSRHIKGTCKTGTWKVGDTNGKCPASQIPLPRGAWCFEFNNAFYPDCDDTAMALMVLAGRFDEARTTTPPPTQSTTTTPTTTSFPSASTPQISKRKPLTLREHDEKAGTTTEPVSGILPPDLRLTVCESVESLDDARQSTLDVADTTAALESGLRWLLSMQNKDGGWAAFDRGNNNEILCKVPFADHNAMIDPSTPDLTGRVMESLGRLGFRVGQNVEIDRVVAYMRKQQQADGSWFGRWGVNYIYGTWQALTGLMAVGVPADDPAIVAGANWLLTHQHPSGGWGESPDSYQNPSLGGHGTPTASQTAWAIMGLIAAGKINEHAVYRGIRFLLDRQRNDGTWFEPEFTGTGFPLVFYLKYHYYSVYFPLMALSLYAAKTKAVNVSVCEEETIFRINNVRVFSPETSFYNNARPDDPPAETKPPIELPEPENNKQPRKSTDKPILRVFFG